MRWNHIPNGPSQAGWRHPYSVDWSPESVKLRMSHKLAQNALNSCKSHRVADPGGMKYIDGYFHHALICTVVPIGAQL